MNIALIFSNTPGRTAYTQERLKTMHNAKNEKFEVGIGGGGGEVNRVY